MVRWTGCLSLGIPKIDSEHEALVGALARLRQAHPLADGRLRHELDEILLHARTHFQNEETLMQNFGYARLYDHQHEHHDFLELLVRLRRAKRVEAEDLDRALAWVLAHIRGLDGAMAYFLKSKAAVAA